MAILSPNTVYHLFIYSIYVKTGQELPHGRQQSNTMPTWATSVKKHCPSRFSLETHCKDTSSLYSKTCSLTIRRAWDLNKSSQVSSDAATSSRGTDAGVGQGASGKPQGRSWHHRVSRWTRAHVGVRSIRFHWWVHVCCIWECKDPKIKNRPMNYMKFWYTSHRMKYSTRWGANRVPCKWGASLQICMCTWFTGKKGN